MRTINDISNRVPLNCRRHNCLRRHSHRINWKLLSAIAGAIALAFILIPIVARTTEESLKLVPNNIREASLALGAHKWRTTLSVVLPSAKSGLITGTLLAVARVAGETAPLIMTILGNRYFFQGLTEPMAALPLKSGEIRFNHTQTCKLKAGEQR